MLVCIGVIGLGIVEAHEDDELRAARQQAANRRYAKSALAIILPVLYCVLDALGTFADSRVLETLDEDSANCAYELTFLVAAVVCFIYVVIIKRQKLVPRREAPKYTGAIFETAGPVRLYLCPRGHAARRPRRADDLGLLRGVRPVGPHLPQGKALLEALSHDRLRRRGHCAAGDV